MREIHFEGDNLVIKRNQICELILERGIKVDWACPNGIRADCADLEMFRLMKKSGCYHMAFGIESANPHILDNIKKHEKLHVIDPNGSFKTGFPSHRSPERLRAVEMA